MATARVERRAERRQVRQPPKQLPRVRLDNRLRSTYGLTLEEFETMSAAQGGLCAICGLPPAGRGKTDGLVVDHCHKEGHVRSLLCGNCNIAIGLLMDDPVILDAAAAYLRRWDAAESVEAVMAERAVR